MTTKHLVGAYPSGYTLAATYSELIIGKSASVGGSGVVANQAATVINYGAVQASSAYGVTLRYGGRVSNLGTIQGAYEGVNLAGGGTLINGSRIDTSAMISAGFQGVIEGNYGGGVYLTNFGTIESQSAGVYMTHVGGSIINGSPGDRQALIHGGAYGGVRVDPPLVDATNNAPTTITNFGTIAGSSGISVQFGLKSNGRVIAESGSTWVGAVLGGGGTLELATGVGTITGLGVTGTVSGAEAMTFSHFDAYILDAGTSWSLMGANATHPVQSFTLAAGATLTLASSARLGLGGQSMLDGAITGAGSVQLTNAVLDDLTLGGSTALGVAGTVDQVGTVTVGDHSALRVTVSILPSGVWEIGGETIARGVSAGDIIKNAGLLINNSGIGVVGTGVTVSGVVEAAAGILDLARSLSGGGLLKIDAGATLEAEANASRTLSADFNGSSATLALATPKMFAATINGFAATDVIDLLKIAASGARINSKDQLVIVDGTVAVATLQLSGAYSGATFNIGSDGHGGTDIALVTSAAASARNTFISAMAQARSQGSVIVTASTPYLGAGRQPTLLAPGCQPA